jgi:hypothetical protein
MEDTMSKCFVIVAGTLAVLAGSTLAFDRAGAGGSTSAPSKYNNAHQVASTAAANRQARRNDFRITEYSSSSAKNPSQKH